MKNRARGKNNGTTRLTPGNSNPTGTVQSFDGRSNLRQDVENTGETPGAWDNPGNAVAGGTRDLEAKVLNASRVRKTPGQN